MQKIFFHFIKLYTLLLLLICLIFLMLYYHNLVSDIHYYKTSSNHTNFLKVVDLYDIDNNQTISSLFKEEDSLERLKEMNADLNKYFGYIEVYQQFLEVYDFYDKDPKFSYGYESGYYIINEEINNHYVTAIKTVQINEEAINQCRLSQAIDSGRIFIAEDFRYHETVPVLLGIEYKGIYNINDKFTANYLGHDFNFKVIGFLKQDTTIDIYNTDAKNIDRSIVMPFFSCKSMPNNSSNTEFQKKYYGQKNCGYIKYDSDLKRDKIKENLYRVSLKNGLIYEGVDNETDFANSIRDKYYSNVILTKTLIVILFILLLVNIMAVIGKIFLKHRRVSLFNV